MIHRFTREACLSALLLLVAPAAISQESGKRVFWSAALSLGYAHAAPNILREYHDAIAASYRSAGVPLATTTAWGSAFGVEGSVRVSRIERISAGVSAAFWYAPASASFQDSRQALALEGYSTSLEVGLVVRARVASLGMFPVYVTVQPGIAYSSFELTDDVNAWDESEADYHARWSSSAWGPCAQGTIGSSVEVGDLILSLDAGWKFGWNIVDEVSIESTAGKMKLYEPWNIGHSGPVVLLSIEERF